MVSRREEGRILSSFRTKKFQLFQLNAIHCDYRLVLNSFVVQVLLLLLNVGENEIIA